jgi:PAS domain-containing protein
MHPLLKRQLSRYKAGEEGPPEKWEKFLGAVDSAYEQSDTDRQMLERSLELSSQELLQTNSELRAVFQAVPDLFLRPDQRGKILDVKGAAQAGLEIVVLTTSKAEEDICKAYDLHANCFVTKPIDLDKFIEIVQKIEQFWLTVVRLPGREDEEAFSGLKNDPTRW